MDHETRLTSAEIGTLWISIYESKMFICLYKYMINSIEDVEIISILKKDLAFIEGFYQSLSTIFENEKLPLPIGFTDEDVNENVPRLCSDGFILYFLQSMSKAGMSKDVTVLALVTRKDLKTLFKKHLDHAYEIYLKVEEVLLERGLYIRSPYIPSPNSVEFVNSNNYLGGLHIFGEKRPLNSIEISHLFMNMEVNLIGMMICTAFSQVAKETDVIKYLLRGKELSKDIFSTCSNILTESEVQAPATWDAEITASTVAPFSDKLMLAFINMLSTYGLGLYSISSAASLRSDIQGKYAGITKDVGAYAKDGIELLITKGWFEQPPTLPDRNRLAKG
ncbi:DUF3231 family protein [Neobacillus sp. D3-1R]|uniref:DUF3231 family protein n=1 Tax=Neobacillus sp. D3-1R TaxID=3445778 RepID=UPI003F9ED6BB